MKTTKKHFKLFKRESKKWIKILGLQGWEVRFKHTPDVGDGNFADARTNSTNRAARLRLNTNWPEGHKLTSKEIRKTAFHEVCHIVMDLVGSCARSRHIMEHEIDEAEHAIIRTLESTLFPRY